MPSHTAHRLPWKNLTTLSEESGSSLLKLGLGEWGCGGFMGVDKPFFTRVLKIMIFCWEAQESSTEFPGPAVQKTNHSRQAVCGAC